MEAVKKGNKYSFNYDKLTKKYPSKIRSGSNKVPKEITKTDLRKFIQKKEEKKPEPKQKEQRHTWKSYLNASPKYTAGRMNYQRVLD